MTKVYTGITSKWSKLAKNWVEDEYGRHCHWCKNADFETEGEVYCGHPKTEYNKKALRIRTCGGMEVAKQCKYFDLSDWYKDDANYDKTFNSNKRAVGKNI